MQKSLKFYVIIFLTAIFFLSYLISYFFITRKYEQIFLTELKISAKMLADQITLTRKWVALHSAVFVEKKDEIEPNPYLKEPYIIDSKGRMYIKMNPAFVTREISKLAEKERGFYFRVTSLKALNPKNIPDEFEKEALRKFEQDKNINEFYRLVENNFRYIIPLYAEESCLSCHRDYKVGNIRGGLSLSLSAHELMKSLVAIKVEFFIAITMFYGLILAGVLMFFNRFVLKPVKELTDFAEGTAIEENKSFLSSREFSILYERLKLARINDEQIKERLKEEVIRVTKELEEIHNKKTDFFLEVGHKLKTPLTVIGTSVDYLLMKGSCEGDKRFLELLKKNIESLKRATSQILKAAQIDMGISEKYFEKINLKQVLKEVMNNFNYENFITEIEDDIYVKGDKEKLTVLFENLIHNAVKFNKIDGKIYIKLKKEDEMAVFIIKDEGKGIDDATKIFQKFYHKDLEGGEKGTGLGLYISKKVVDLHGGSITFVSEKNKGTEFTVKIPL